ncbi:MAG: L-glutamate gamma-semialdehyde dehydrogenase, partial [Bacillota bacterium]
MAIYSYQTEPLTPFSKEEYQKAYLKGLEKVKSYVGASYDLVINGKRVKTNKQMKSLNPSNHQEVIGTISQASIEHADLALDSALKAFETWKYVKPEVRADVLFKSAAILRRRKFEFAALMTLEAGKPWIEADADVAEAIDFLEYYGRQMLQLEHIDQVVLSRRDLERNEYKYIPLGVGAVISPWNFPLAILVGMSSAAIVSGNTVLLKPASTTQVIAYKFVEVLEEAGLPNGVINFIPGSGAEIGDYIVNHPKIRFISFTGSKEVGISIYEKAAKVHKGQIWLKRVIAEMGGKDTIVVDKDADLDLAADAIIKSAFGFSGQKCSACSRAVIHQDVYDVVVEKMLNVVKTLPVGPAELKETFVGPVNDSRAFEKITSYFEVGNKEGKLIFGGKADSSKGYFIEPTIYIDVKPDARLMQEEIFGPILAVCKVKDFNEALDVANNTEYGLTGAVISNNRMHLEKARREFHVGNLYFNR